MSAVGIIPLRARAPAVGSAFVPVVVAVPRGSVVVPVPIPVSVSFALTLAILVVRFVLGVFALTTVVPRSMAAMTVTVSLAPLTLTVAVMVAIPIDVSVSVAVAVVAVPLALTFPLTLGFALLYGLLPLPASGRGAVFGGFTFALSQPFLSMSAKMYELRRLHAGHRRRPAFCLLTNLANAIFLPSSSSIALNSASSWMNGNAYDDSSDVISQSVA